MRLPLLIAAGLFLLIPALELWLLIVLHRHLGLGHTLGLLLLTGVAGFWLARWQGWRTLRRIQSELAAGRMPSAALVDGVLILVAGVLLITPGLLTDAMGFLLLLPPIRYVVRRSLVAWFGRHRTGQAFVFGTAGRAAAEDPDTVEGRAVSVEDADNEPRLGAGDAARQERRP